MTTEKTARNPSVPRWVTEFQKADEHFDKVSSLFRTPEEVIHFVETTEYASLLPFHKAGAEARKVRFEFLYNALKLDFVNSSFLDLGPGYGDSLDLAKTRGGADIHFADYDPYIAIFNSLKGHIPHRMNYCSNELIRLFPRKFDIIMTVGGISADYFMRNHYAISFEAWLYLLDNLASETGQIIIAPTFDRKETRHGNFFWCEDINAFRQGPFVRTLLEYGYKMLFIDGFNHKDANPFTFHKCFNDRSAALLCLNKPDFKKQIKALYPVLIKNYLDLLSSTPNPHTLGDLSNAILPYLVNPDSAQLEPFYVRLLRAYIRTFWKSLAASPDRNSAWRVAVFGAGKHTAWLTDVVAGHDGPEVVAVLDTTPDPERSFWGLPTIRPESLCADSVDAILISSDTTNREMISLCRNLFGDTLKILDFYESFPRGPYPKGYLL